MKFYNKNYSRLAGWLLAQPSTENTRERERKLLLFLRAYSAQARLKVLKLQAEVDEESGGHQEHQGGSERAKF